MTCMISPIGKREVREKNSILRDYINLRAAFLNGRQDDVKREHCDTALLLLET